MPSAVWRPLPSPFHSQRELISKRENEPMSNILKALLLIAGLGVAQDASAANILVNGSFEAPVQGTPLFATFNIPAGSTFITGWTVVQGNVDLTNTCCYAPSYNGLQAVDLIFGRCVRRVVTDFRNNPESRVQAHVRLFS
jgi:hypothetical protein